MMAQNTLPATAPSCPASRGRLTAPPRHTGSLCRFSSPSLRMRAALSQGRALRGGGGSVFSNTTSASSSDSASVSSTASTAAISAPATPAAQDTASDSCKPMADVAIGASAARSNTFVGGVAGSLYPDQELNSIQEAWQSLLRWSRMLRDRSRAKEDVLKSTKKIVVFGGGSFGTALAKTLAMRKDSLDVVLLMRDQATVSDINTKHINTKYLKDFSLPANLKATTDPKEAIVGSQFAILAVPCQQSRGFLKNIKHLLPDDLPIICVSKGLELGTGDTMAQIITSVLGSKQKTCFLSGPSFAREVMEERPTSLVCASKDARLAERVQDLMACDFVRINTSDDVVGLEICGALKNVLAIAAGIVDGMDLGHNASAALVVQGCAEIRWLAERMGAKPTTVSGLSGLGDIMLTCYVDLSRNRTVGLRLGAGEPLEDILASSSQVAEGVATAGVVVTLARKYRVQLPVLTAVAQVLGNELGPKEAVAEIMQLPQVAER